VRQDSLLPLRNLIGKNNLLPALSSGGACSIPQRLCPFLFYHAYNGVVERGGLSARKALAPALRQPLKRAFPGPFVQVDEGALLRDFDLGGPVIRRFKTSCLLLGSNGL
jgi:hypothetical protein